MSPTARCGRDVRLLGIAARPGARRAGGRGVPRRRGADPRSRPPVARASATRRPCARRCGRSRPRARRRCCAPSPSTSSSRTPPSSTTACAGGASTPTSARRAARVARRGVRAAARRPGGRRCARRLARRLARARADRPPDRGDAAHAPRARTSGSPSCSRALDDPALTARRARASSRTQLAEEITILWQTDEVRGERPRVVDEIRHGLWFFEESLFDAGERLLADYRRRVPGRAAAVLVRHAGSAATSTATPRSAATRSPLALDRARALALARYRSDVRALAQALALEPLARRRLA